MGLSACKHADPGHRAVARSPVDRCPAQDAGQCRRQRTESAAQRLIAALCVALAACFPAAADTLRIATYHTELSRKGPGLLLRDIAKGDDAQVQAVAQVVASAAPDILVLQGVDWDLQLRTLGALRDAIAAAGWRFDHLFALRPNSGMASGLDLDGDGRLGEPEDAQGYGRFAGARSMAILSRFSVETGMARDFSALLWADLPGAILPADMPDDVRAAQRLARVGHWVVPLRVAGARIHLLVFHATPPVFDGPEDRNGRRNHDELAFWQLYLDGAFGPPPVVRFVLLGNANLDPVDGEGRKGAIRALLTDPRLQDPAPRRPGPVAPEPRHHSDAALDTVAWPAPGPGNRRVSYVLPSADLTVTDAGVFWPTGDDPHSDAAAQASRHRLVWVDIAVDW